jgi:hypothetical protein
MGERMSYSMHRTVATIVASARHQVGRRHPQPTDQTHRHPMNEVRNPSSGMSKSVFQLRPTPIQEVDASWLLYAKDILPLTKLSRYNIVLRTAEKANFGCGLYGPAGRTRPDCNPNPKQWTGPRSVLLVLSAFLGTLLLSRVLYKLGAISDFGNAIPDNPILNAPFEAPSRHWPLDFDGGLRPVRHS